MVVVGRWVSLPLSVIDVWGKGGKCSVSEVHLLHLLLPNHSTTDHYRSLTTSDHRCNTALESLAGCSLRFSHHSVWFGVWLSLVQTSSPSSLPPSPTVDRQIRLIRRMMNGGDDDGGIFSTFAATATTKTRLARGICSECVYVQKD